MSFATYFCLWWEIVTEQLPPVVGQDHTVVLWLLTESWEIDETLIDLFLGNPTVWLTEREERLSKHEAPACVTVQTESADCRWYEGNRCRPVLQSCSSVWCHFLEGREIVLPRWDDLNLILLVITSHYQHLQMRHWSNLLLIVHINFSMTKS